MPVCLCDNMAYNFEISAMKVLETRKKRLYLRHETAIDYIDDACVFLRLCGAGQEHVC